MSFSAWRQRLGKLKFTLTVVVLALLCVWAGYEVGNARLGWLEAQHKQHSQRIERLQQTIDNLEYQNNILKVERDVDRVAIERLQRDLRTSHDETSRIRRELAFYQRVMAPELDAEGVTVDSFDIIPGGANLYHFRTVLVQVERAQQGLTQGRVSATLRGRYDDESAEYDLFELAGLADEQREFAMNYFTRIDGSFQLPVGFSAEQVVLEVRTRNGRETERQFLWGELLSPLDLPLQLDEDLDR